MAKIRSVILKPETIVEPLVDCWHAWPHLISPATAARNITERHLPIMESYLKAPELHAKAAANPMMAGGPFMDYDGYDRSKKVQELISKTLGRRARTIALSNAIAELDRMLEQNANGGSLTPLYEQVPESLQGLVELHYNRNGSPGFRIIESLMYADDHEGLEAQSLLLRSACVRRPFIMSTPHLATVEDLSVQLPFNHPGVSMLLEMFWRSRPIEEVAEALDLEKSAIQKLRTLTTETTPNIPSPRKSRWRFFGHACVLLESPVCTILIDPAIKTNTSPRKNAFSFSDLPDWLDYVLLTHNHQDHVILETLLRLRTRIGKILVPPAGNGGLLDPSLRLMLERIGFNNVVEMDEFQSIDADGATITATPFLGEHGDLAIRCKTTWHVQFGERRFLFAADCKTISPYLFQRVRDTVGSVDTLFLGMECDGAPMSWIYGPLFSRPPAQKHDQSRRLAGCDVEEACELVQIFKPREVYVYALGMEDWLNHIIATSYTPESKPILASQQFVETCRAQGMRAERLSAACENLL